MTLVALLALMALIGFGATAHSQILVRESGKCWGIDFDFWPKTWRTQ